MIYLASPWFDDEAEAFCKDVEEFIISTGNDAYFPRRHQFENAQETFDANVRNILNCDMLIALVFRKDVGTAWEIGLAYATDKPIILVGKDCSTFESKTNLMLAKCGSAMTFENLKKYLSNDVSYDIIDFSKNWEGIE